MRQGRQFRRYVERLEFLLDMRAPVAGTNQTFAKPVLQSLLVANVSCGPGQGLLADIGRPECQHTRLVSVQIAAFAACKALQNFLQGLSAARNLALPCTRAVARCKVEVLVHDAEIAAVVQHSLVGRVTREYIDPEIHIGLQFRRLWEGVCGERGCAGQQTEEEQKASWACHLD